MSDLVSLLEGDFLNSVGGVVSGAVLSDDGLYRYRLWRAWGDGPRMAFVMLNPSTADADVDDPTIRRCIGFAKRERFDGIEVVNLYALRTTKPKHLLDHPDPEGPDNWKHWRDVLAFDTRVGPRVAAWGAFSARDLPKPRVLDIWSEISFLCLGRTASGAPRHPLYVRADEPLVPLVPSGDGLSQTALADAGDQGVAKTIGPGSIVRSDDQL